MGKPVVHFEIYGKDSGKLQKFYADLFGWEIHADNPMNYGFVHTGAEGKGIDGGITEGERRVNIVIEVDTSRSTSSSRRAWAARRSHRSPRSRAS